MTLLTTLLAGLPFLLGLLYGWYLQHWWPLLAYGAMSVASFAAYGLDKHRARQAQWRLPENLLHLLDLAGGWPGGLLAQRRFRHKTRKTRFQLLFWCIVLLHLALWLGWLPAWLRLR
ncbi:DUF1294 domain-containing protein [Zobellella maritima]|uniref:DUF1294 domain-containing protein n=1 Tax=Zobellella maritima TaxID=2059725 RepID=UPI000E305D3E|nr:DUF1294 domain-containing protein [Zobellella maritima]